MMSEVTFVIDAVAHVDNLEATNDHGEWFADTIGHVVYDSWMKATPDELTVPKVDSLSRHPSSARCDLPASAGDRVHVAR